MLLPICWLWGIEKCHLWLWYHSWHIDFITRAYGTRDKFNVFTCDYHNHAWHFSMPQSQQIVNIPLMFWHGLFQIPIFVVSLICYSSMIIEQQIRATTKIGIWKNPCENVSVYHHLPSLLLIYACSQSSYMNERVINY